jgi:hypothetical protein
VLVLARMEEINSMSVEEIYIDAILNVILNLHDLHNKQKNKVVRGSHANLKDPRQPRSFFFSFHVFCASSPSASESLHASSSA